MIVFTLKETGATPGVMRREYPKVAKAAFLKAGRFWQSKMLPGHFTRKAISKYDYQPRQGDRGSAVKSRLIETKVGGKTIFRRTSLKSTYTAKKKRLKGHTKPLVWTGASRALSGTGRVTSTKSRFRVTVRAPTLNRRLHMRREVVAVTPDEAVRLGEMIENFITVRFNRMKQRTRKRL
jgi:hypothetical protein